MKAGSGRTPWTPQVKRKEKVGWQQTPSHWLAWRSKYELRPRCLLASSMCLGQNLSQQAGFVFFLKPAENAPNCQEAELPLEVTHLGPAVSQVPRKLPAQHVQAAVACS